jgi:hypothetical protein
MRTAEVLPPARLRALLGPAQRGAPASAEDELAEAMHRLGTRAPSQHAQRMEELAYLANVLVAGCSLEGRAFRPAEAARAVLATCNLGLEHVHRAQTEAVDGPLARGADWLFRVGWRLLAEEAASPAARAVEARLGRGQGFERSGTATRELAALRAALSSDQPWTARARLAGRAGIDDQATAAALLALLDECPHLGGCLLASAAEPGTDGRGLGFIARREQLREVGGFLAGLPR